MTADHNERVDSNRLIDSYFDRIMLRYRYIDSTEADTTCTLFGKTFRTPIFAAPLAMLQKIHESGAAGYGKAVKNAGSAFFSAWLRDEDVAAVCAQGTALSRGVKPFADHDRIRQCIAFAEEQGAFAVNIDIDHIFEADGSYCRWALGQLGRQTCDDLKSYVEATKLPVILKGINTAEDARKCREIGIGGIILSSHNNRFPSEVPPLVALPEIREAVGEDYPVLVDGGIVSGVEAFKALALGADAVLVCRALMKQFPSGPDAVTETLEKMRRELAGCMSNTGCANLRDIGPDRIRFRNW